MTDNSKDDLENKTLNCCNINHSECVYSEDLFFKFISKEKDALKIEINQLKQGQIALLTGTISAVALIFTFLFNFYLVIDSKFYAYYMFLPLLVLIPSEVIFFHKGYEINEKTAYIQLINKKTLNHYFFKGYQGYENYKPDFDSENINLKSTKRKKSKAESICEIFFANIGNRFWSMAFWAYTGLIIINFIVPIHLLNSDSVTEIDPVWVYFTDILSIGIIIPYIIGKSYSRSKNYWKRYGLCVYSAVIMLPFMSLFTYYVISGIIIHNTDEILKTSSLLITLMPYLIIGLLIFSVYIIATGISSFYDENSMLCKNKTEILPLVITMISIFIFAGLISASFSAIGTLISYIVILVSFAMIIFSFSEAWNLKFGNKSIPQLESKWEIFVNNYTSEMTKFKDETRKYDNRKENDEVEFEAIKIIPVEKE
ncbi:hypothetical protein J2128_000539 [Methanomicrobium sp. W14]|uniref:hypothetical protein n=1 Tax=Methanomicrobium sp. W14 TaxID=2817839 RepID=UPI001AEB6CE4|nr:hypothetical protein [Methanomicrobium sp. W14]MBP2132618.1 hypothetical protein [Methanomicrobium sp. W14]